MAHSRVGRIRHVPVRASASPTLSCRGLGQSAGGWRLQERRPVRLRPRRSRAWHSHAPRREAGHQAHGQGAALHMGPAQRWCVARLFELFDACHGQLALGALLKPTWCSARLWSFSNLDCCRFGSLWDKTSLARTGFAIGQNQPRLGERSLKIADASALPLPGRRLLWRRPRSFAPMQGGGRVLDSGMHCRSIDDSSSSLSDSQYCFWWGWWQRRSAGIAVVRRW